MREAAAVGSAGCCPMCSKLQPHVPCARASRPTTGSVAPSAPRAWAATAGRGCSARVARGWRRPSRSSRAKWTRSYSRHARVCPPRGRPGRGRPGRGRPCPDGRRSSEARGEQARLAVIDVSTNGFARVGCGRVSLVRRRAPALGFGSCKVAEPYYRAVRERLTEVLHITRRSCASCSRLPQNLHTSPPPHCPQTDKV